MFSGMCVNVAFSVNDEISVGDKFMIFSKQSIRMH